MARKPTPSADVPPVDWATFGWLAPHYTGIPDDLFDRVMPHLTGAELKVLLYIMRRTFGFKKTVDAISLDQFCNGIVTHEGERLDWGTGLGKSTVSEALKTLREKNLIVARSVVDPERGTLPTTYALHMKERGGHPPERDRGFAGANKRVRQSGRGAPGRAGPQQTVLQQTVNKDGPTRTNRWKNDPKYGHVVE